MDELPDDIRRLIAAHTAITPLKHMCMCIAEIENCHFYPSFMDHQPLTKAFWGIRCNDGIAFAYKLDENVPSVARCEDDGDEDEDDERPEAAWGFDAVRNRTGTRLCHYQCYDFSHSAVPFGVVTERQHPMRTVLAMTCTFFSQVAMPTVTTNCVVPRHQWIRGIHCGDKEAETNIKLIVVETKHVRRTEARYQRKEHRSMFG